VNILKLFGIIFGINIVDYAISLLSTIIVVKNLGVAEYGTFSFLNTISSFVFTFFTLGLSQYNYKIIPGRDLQFRYKILGNTLFIELSVTVLGVIFIYLVFYKKIELNTLYILFLFRLLICMVNNELIRYFGYEKKLLQKNIIGLIDSKLWILPLFIYLIIKANLNLLVIIFSQCISSIITLLVCSFFLSKDLILKNFKYDKHFISIHLKSAIAFIFVDVGVYLLEMSVRYILTFHGSLISLGLFSFAYSWISIILKFGMLIIYILQPYLSNIYYESKIQEKKSCILLYQVESMMIKYSIYLVVFGLGYFIVFFDDLVLLVGKADYLQTKVSVLFLAPLAVFMCICYFLQIIILLSGKTSKIPICYFLMAGINIVLNIIFVPRFDYMAAALISSTSYFFLMITLLVILPKKSIKLQYSFKNYASFVIEYLSFLLIMSALRHFMSSMLVLKFCISGVVVLLYIVVIYTVNKKDFHVMNNIVRGKNN
jgi:O-antigen/teichoic acid export membrane protein